jgi:hypothetical protein
MRGYPDVALLAHNIDTIVNDNFFPGSGTSASVRGPLPAARATLDVDNTVAKPDVVDNLVF